MNTAKRINEDVIEITERRVRYRDRDSLQRRIQRTERHLAELQATLDALDELEDGESRSIEPTQEDTNGSR